MELQVTPEPLDDMQAHIARVVGANHIVTGKFQDAAYGIPQDRTSQVTNMERLVRVGMGKLDHDALVDRRSGSKTVILFQDGIHHPACIFYSVKIQVEVTFHSFNATDASKRTNLILHLSCNFLGALSYDHLFTGARLSSRGAKKRCGYDPFPAEGNRFPLQYREGYPIRIAECSDLGFDSLLFSFKHDHSQVKIISSA